MTFPMIIHRFEYLLVLPEERFLQADECSLETLWTLLNFVLLSLHLISELKCTAASSRILISTYTVFTQSLSQSFTQSCPDLDEYGNSEHGSAWLP